MHSNRTGEAEVLPLYTGSVESPDERTLWQIRKRQ
jgi:hypothetical protein